MGPDKEQLREHAATIIEFNRLCFDKTYNGDKDDLDTRVTDLLYALLENWSTYNQTLLTWRNAAPINCGDVIFIHTTDAATDVHLQILMNKDGIFLEMSIAHPENLHRMPDDFWLRWLELSRFGKFELSDNESFGDIEESQYPELFPKNTSSIFKLMRKLIAYPIFYGDTMDLGNLSIHWPYDQYSISEVFEKGCLAFERLSLLNNWVITGIIPGNTRGL